MWAIDVTMVRPREVSAACSAFAMRKQDNIGARALQFAILTAARSGEVRGATWDEIDMKHAVWQIPAERMKTGGKPHRVPLSKPALALLQSMQLLGSGLIFPGRSLRRPMNSETLTQSPRRMGYDDLTVHGFRSTFRDWAAEATGYPNHVAEQALAPTIGTRVERAYRRGDPFAKRVALMDDWAAYLARSPAQVVP